MFTASEPHFQGRLDIFCSIYAAINALVLTHDLSSDRARKILHESIMLMSRDPDMFQKQLDQTVEYHDVVDGILNRELLRYDLLVSSPFGDETEVDKGKMWETLSRWLSRPQRAVVLRFVRPLDLPGKPEIRHWSTARFVKGDVIKLFDCSLERSAISEIAKASCITAPEGLCPGLVYLDPSSIRLVGAEV